MLLIKSLRKTNRIGLMMRYKNFQYWILWYSICSWEDYISKTAKNNAQFLILVKLDVSMFWTFEFRCWTPNHILKILNKPENPFQTMMEQRMLIKLKPILSPKNFWTIVDLKNEVFRKPDSGHKTAQGHPRKSGGSHI